MSNAMSTGKIVEGYFGRCDRCPKRDELEAENRRLSDECAELKESLDEMHDLYEKQYYVEDSYCNRIAELEDIVKFWQANSVKLRAENDRLRKFIVDAPHDIYCSSVNRMGSACTCWKKETLNDD